MFKGGRTITAVGDPATTAEASELDDLVLGRPTSQASWGAARVDSATGDGVLWSGDGLFCRIRQMHAQQ